ncbi:hypothetical protein [Polyangium jinanense]|uniref:Uncharacterized protein n=1 Tax=Polyangium jinanense TaxID=2829994 RepID=A0A9X4AQS5_9BACT|nr:hypothetical protein [Polyangium jinanense]MDC3954835.1 hypothetical protein [Polyangium jinanense]MDC3981394.1 hypothetical protein [Polyangium jinanense]
MNDKAGRARIVSIVALAGLLVGAALFVRSRFAEAPETRDPAASPVGVEQAPVASPVTTRPTAMGATNVTIPEPASALPGETRKPLEPDDYVRNGSKEPLMPRELRVDVELSPRGPLTAEPLVPHVLEANAELSPRGAMTTEPLPPRVLEVQAAPAER